MLGALVGPLLDRAHAMTGAIVYDTPVTFIGVPWWVTLVYTGAALGIGLSHPALDQLLLRRQKLKLSPAMVGAGFIAMSVLWIGSGVLPLSNVFIAVTIGFGAMFMWLVFDRTWQGAALALATGMCGVFVESTLVRFGLFHHAKPDLWGLPVWLPCVYFAASIAIGNLARLWTLAHQTSKSAIPRAPNLS